jgi:hypothetical protein
MVDERRRQVADLGAPTSYLTLPPGAPVLSSDGRVVGTVEHVLADANVDVFDGLVIDTRLGAGGWRFVDAAQIASLHENGVELNLDCRQAEKLPEPSENPASMAAGPDETVPDDLSDKLRRAWELVSGKY